MTGRDTNCLLAGRPRAHWLVLGAASVGVGASLLGFSLLGPQTGIAAADGTGETTVSAGPSTRDRADTARTTGTQRRAERRAARAESRQARRADRAAAAEPSSSDSESEAANVTSVTATSATTTSSRRRLVNKAPTATPVQLTGVTDGLITGTVGAVDPEGDPLTYRIRRAPREGSVQLGDDGTYTYTPSGQFDGVDTFRVSVSDGNPFRPWGTSATSLINQGAVTFVFEYGTGAQYWTPERRDALQDAANDLLPYFRVSRPVTLTYTVTGENDPESGGLAAAGSDFVSERPGFWPVVVQKKLLTGRDANGAAPDGEIEWNFGYAWGLGDAVGADEYDFASTAMHELLHSFGFVSGIQEPGDNSAEPVWTILDRYVRTPDGRTPFTFTYRWMSRYDPLLTGADGGLFLGGANAVAAYGGLVPLYTPDPWEQGSSVSHLDDATFTGADEQIMNARTGTGPGVRVLSAVELGILKDLGYQVVTPQNSAAAFAGLLILVRRRRAARSGGKDAA
ncbi:cadherin-like domain-containing protein [Mycolicibacterium sp. 3033]|nr:cadherin-like domain-containing protein [Mycolicibacterium aurantiacum]